MDSLESPPNRVLYHLGSDRCYLDRAVRRRHFSHCVQLILPCAGAGLPQHIRNMPESYFLVRQVELTAFLDFNFISAFIMEGTLSVVTAYNPGKTNSMAITPTGILIVNLTRDLFYRLGLEAKQNKVLKRKRGFDLDIRKVTIDLKSPKFYPGSRKYERVLECFKRVGFKYDVIVDWTPPNDTLARSSPVLYLTKKFPDLEWKECLPKFHITESFNVRVPDAITFDFFDWSGLIAANAEDALEEHDTHVIPNLICAQWTGFLNQRSLQELVVWLRNAVPDVAAFGCINSIAFESDPTVEPNALFHNTSLLSLCFDRSTQYHSFEQPPISNRS